MANGPGGTEVGRVYIRVLPNTAEFKAKLKAAIKGMNEEVEVGVTANTAKAEAKIKELSKRSSITLVADLNTAKAKAELKLIDDKQVTIQARALTQKAAAELDALTNRRRNLNIRVDAITAAATAKLAQLDKKREVTIEAHLNDLSIKKAEARIQALDRKRDLVLRLDSKQVTKRFNRLKAQMRHLTSQLEIQTDPEALVRIRAQLAEVSRGFKLMGDIKLRGREEVVATLEALKKRYQVVIEARSSQVDRTLAKIDSEMAALREKAKVHLQAVFDGAKAKGEYELWEKSLKAQALKVAAALDTAKATVDWETYKAMLEGYRVEIMADLDTARASTDSVALKERIEALRAKLKVELSEKSVAAVKAQIDILSRDYKFELNAVVQDKFARLTIENLARDRNAYFKAVLDTKKAMIQFAALDHDRIAEVHVRLENALKAQAELIALGKTRTAEYKAEVKNAGKAEAELEYLTRDRTVHIKLKRDWKSKLFAALSNDIDRTGRKTRFLSRIFTNLGGAVAKTAQLIGGGLVTAVGKATTFFGGAGEGMTALGQEMVSTATKGLGSMVASGAQAGIVLALLVAVVGACIAVFAGLTAAILAVAAALLGMVLVIAMLAVVLVGAALGAIALIAVPGAFIAGTIAMISASKSLQKEFKDLTKTFREVFREAAKPWTAEFKKQIPKLTKWLRGMKDEFRDLFSAASKHLDDFRIGIQNFVENILPGLTDGMNSKGFGKFTKALSEAMGTIGKAFGDSFNILAQNGGKFADVITEIGRGLGEVLPSLSRFLSSLATGAKSTGQIADGVAGMFDELAESFNKALASDGWKQAVSGFSDMLTDFGDAIGEGFETAMEHGDDFRDAFKALGDFMQGISEPLAEFTGSAAGQFADVMPSVTKGMQDIIPAMQKFTESFAKFAPDVVTEISDAIADLFDYLARPDVAKACADITKALIQFTKEALGPETLDTVLGITDAVTQILKIIGPLIPYIIKLTSGAGAVAHIGDLIRKLVDWWNQLPDVINRAKAAIGEWASEMDAKLSSTLKGWEQIKYIFAAAIEFIKLQFALLVTAIQAQWVIIWTGAQIAWALIWAVVQSALAIMAALFRTFIDQVISLWNLLVTVAVAAWNFIVANIRGAIQIIKGIFSIFVGVITGDWGRIKSGAASVWKGIQTIVQGAVNFIKSLGSGLASYFRDRWNSIQSAASGAWSRISSAFSGAMSAIKGAASDAVSWVIGKFNSLKDAAGDAVSNLNPANWFSAALDLDVNLNMGSLPSPKALSVPLGYDSPSARMLSSLSADTPWKGEASTFAAGIDQANSAFNSSLAIAGRYEPSSSTTTDLISRRGADVTVYAETNADPVEIGREVAWALRRK